MDKVILTLNKLTFNYGNNRVLNNISLDFEKGKFYGVLGPNGCGKTTLLDIIIKYKVPVSGNIKIKNKCIKEYSNEEIAKTVSIVPQDFYINFPFTVENIIWMGRYPYIPRFSSPGEENREIVERVIEDLELSDLRNKLITKLSGGEKQRVVFARAIAQNTPILLIDEGTSNMDIRHSIYILNYVKNLVKNYGKTIIAVFHNLNLASLYCDNLVFIKNGHIIATGETEKVFCKEIIEDTFDVKCHIYGESSTGKKQMIWNIQ